MKISKKDLKKLILEELREAAPGEAPEPGKSFADTQMSQGASPTSAGDTASEYSPEQLQTMLTNTYARVRQLQGMLTSLNKDLENVVKTFKNAPAATLEEEVEEEE